MYKISKITTDFFQENIWFVSNEKTETVIIDPGEIELEQVTSFLDIHKLKPIAILNTHGHPDHIAGAALLQEQYGIPFYIHEQEKFVLDNVHTMAAMVGMTDLKLPENILYMKGKKLRIQDFNFEIINTPGHTPGSICIKFGLHLISGDTLFRGSVGRVDLPGGSMEQMKKSIEMLKNLDHNINVYPGHGPCTTIAEEINHNPYF
ncbi:MAG: MBL fold metallo-hydrolase [Fidelibacterota bacterium]